MNVKDSKGRRLPHAPYDQATDLQSEIVRVDWLNFAIHVMNASERGWEFQYYPKHRLCMILPSQKTNKQPYSCFHPETPYHEEPANVSD